MRVACSLGSLLDVGQVVECARSLSGTSVDSVWVPETWGMEGFAMLGAVSGANSTQKLGSSIVNVYSRSPSLIAMGAATIDRLSRGRLILGLGTSTAPMVENFHGYPFKDPLARVKEYVCIIRKALSGRRIDHSGRTFDLKGFALLRPPDGNIPIYLAAVNRRMLGLAWDVADGAILYLRPISEMRRTIPMLQDKRRIDAACQIITCVSEDADAAISRAKKTLAFYISVGRTYREFLASNGYAKETEAVLDEFKKAGFEGCSGLVPDRMLDEIAICGAPEQCKKQLRRFCDAGVDLPIIQFNPVGGVADSFDLLKRTLLVE